MITDPVEIIKIVQAHLEGKIVELDLNSDTTIELKTESEPNWRECKGHFNFSRYNYRINTELSSRKERVIIIKSEDTTIVLLINKQGKVFESFHSKYGYNWSYINEEEGSAICMLYSVFKGSDMSIKKFEMEEESK